MVCQLPATFGVIAVLNLFSGLLVPGLVLTVMLIGVGSITLALQQMPWRRKRRSPFTSQFLRGPGQSVWHQLDELRLDVTGYLLGLLLFPLMLLSIPLVQTSLTGKAITHSAILMYVMIGIAACAYLLVKLYRTARKAQTVRLGYEGEVAVGQELNHFMCQGFQVFHDFPADDFNIDHVVVGRTGVFAVETKARGKPDSGNRKQDAQVEFTGTSLKFPSWSESKPLEQARSQAKWLSRWLESAVGEPVPVIAVLAIPGWFVARTGRSDVLAYNGKRPEAVFPKYRGKPLTDPMIRRVCHQLEAKCRDIAPRVYVEENRKAS
jgi:hypothetical protein